MRLRESWIIYFTSIFYLFNLLWTLILFFKLLSIFILYFLIHFLLYIYLSFGLAFARAVSRAATADSEIHRRWIAGRQLLEPPIGPSEAKIPMDDIILCDPAYIERYRSLCVCNLASEIRNLAFSHFHVVRKKELLVKLFFPLMKWPTMKEINYYEVICSSIQEY